MQTTPSRRDRISNILFWKYSGAEVIPNGRRLKPFVCKSRGSCKIGHQSKKILGIYPSMRIFDIKLFNPNAQSYRQLSLESCYKCKKKKRATNRESLTWNTDPLLHLCSAPLAAWEGLPRYFMPILPTSYPSNDRRDMQQQWDCSGPKSTFFDESSNYAPLQVPAIAPSSQTVTD